MVVLRRDDRPAVDSGGDRRRGGGHGGPFVDSLDGDAIGASTQLTWLSAVRVHPINDAVPNMVAAAVLVLAGFDPTTLAVAVPFFTLYAIGVHADLDWTYGPLRYVVASPVFHRWHHTTEAEGLDKNYAGLLPLWDVLFGTFHLPAGQRPNAFGVLGSPVPEGFWPQLTYPFRRHSSS